MTATSTVSRSLSARDKSLVDLVHKLSSVRAAQDLMDIVRHEARTLLGADGVTFVLRDGEYCYYAEEDAISPLWKGMRFPLTACISGWAMLNHKTVAIQDIYQDQRIPHDAYRLTFVKSLVMVPVRSEDPIAAIGAYWAEEHLPTQEETTILETIANAAAVALTNVGLIHSLHGMIMELQQRNKELDIAYRSRASFLGNMSHELRTPLNIIIGMSEGIKRQLHGALGDERYITYAQEIQNAGQNLHKLIEDILDMTAMGSGSSPLELQPLHLSHIISDCIDFVSKGAQDKKIKIENNIPEALPLVKGDARMFKQLFFHILSNSLKFTPEGGTIRITAQSDGKDVSCSITDNGIGMTEEEIKQATRPFQQIDERLERRFQGAGLGLALCKGYVELHNGQMDIQSMPQKGTTVTVTFSACN